MKILMMTNTYFPVVGGIERSIRSFSWAFRSMGHEVLIVAPTPAGKEDRREKVIRIPAIEHNQEPKFSINLPLPGILSKIMRRFSPDIVHSHYPFFMGDYALRLSREFNVPLVFTHHIMFEHYTHYLPFPSKAVKRFTTKLAAGYANWAQEVIAPCESVRAILQHRGVMAPIDVVPTGIDTKIFAKGHPKEFRQRFNIPADAFVVGHVGRLAPEKNLKFLIPCMVDFLKKTPRAQALIVGEGISVDMIRQYFKRAGLAQRLHMPGVLHGQDLVEAYHAMDVFAFASLSETQGVVLAEAMASATPVIALDAPGVREVVKDYYNGRLIGTLNRPGFVKALQWYARLPAPKQRMIKTKARHTAKEFDLDRCARRMLKIYQSLIDKNSQIPHGNGSWHAFAERFKAEWDILKNLMEATEAAVSHA